MSRPGYVLDAWYLGDQILTYDIISLINTGRFDDIGKGIGPWFYVISTSDTITIRAEWKVVGYSLDQNDANNTDEFTIENSLSEVKAIKFGYVYRDWELQDYIFTNITTNQKFSIFNNISSGTM